MVSGSFALLILCLQLVLSLVSWWEVGHLPEREQSPIEWKDFQSVHLFVSPSVFPSVRTLWLSLSLGWLGLKSGCLGQAG